MKTIFFISIFFLIYPYLLYPLSLYILANLLGRGGRRYTDLQPSVSLIISAYNEEAVIADKIENSLALDYPEGFLEIIVASESTDGTNGIVRGYEGRGVRLMAFEERSGKAATLYRVVPQSRGEIIVFSDANGMYRSDAISRLVRNFSDEGVGCVSGRVEYANPHGTSIGKSESAYWGYEQVIKRLSSKLRSLLGANGCIFALRRSAYLPIDKFRGDDFELPVNAAIEGYVAILEPDAVAYEEVSMTTKAEFKRKRRIISWNFVSAILLLRRAVRKGRFLIAYQLISHKLLRWLVPLFLIAAFIGNIFLLSDNPDIYAIIFALQALFYWIAIIGLIFPDLAAPIRLAGYFLMVNSASLIAVIHSIFKEEFTWEKER